MFDKWYNKKKDGQTGRYNVVVRTAEEVKNYAVLRKVLITLLGVLLTLIALIYIVTVLYARYGSFTVSVNKSDTVKYSLTLSEDSSFTKQIVRLNAKASTDITNISTSDLPDDLEAINGEHNGDNYLAYTFYMKNVGVDIVDYEYEMHIVNVTNDVDTAARIRIYCNGVPTTYARTRSDGTGPEPGTTEFITNRVVARERVNEFKPGDITKFTIVIWLEGDDPECLDPLIGGSMKVDMNITVVQARSE